MECESIAATSGSPQTRLGDPYGPGWQFRDYQFARALFGWRPDIILFTSPPLPVSVPAWLLGLLNAAP